MTVDLNHSRSKRAGAPDELPFGAEHGKVTHSVRVPGTGEFEHLNVLTRKDGATITDENLSGYPDSRHELSVVVSGRRFSNWRGPNVRLGKPGKLGLGLVERVDGIYRVGADRSGQPVVRRVSPRMVQMRGIRPDYVVPLEETASPHVTREGRVMFLGNTGGIVPHLSGFDTKRQPLGVKGDLNIIPKDPQMAIPGLEAYAKPRRIQGSSSRLPNGRVMSKADLPAGEEGERFRAEFQKPPSAFRYRKYREGEFGPPRGAGRAANAKLEFGNPIDPMRPVLPGMEEYVRVGKLGRKRSSLGKNRQ